MKKFADILKFLHLSILAAVFCCVGIGEAWGQENENSDAPAYLYNNVWDNKKIKDYYKDNNLAPESLNSEILSIIRSHEKDVSFFGGGKMKLTRLQNSLETLLTYTGKDGFDKFDIKGRSTASRQVDKINDFVNELTSLGVFSNEEYERIKSYTNEVYNLGAERAIAANKEAGFDTNAALIQNLQSNTSELLEDKCPTVDNIRAKYYAGCWSCLVVEKLSSAFLTTASKAYSLSQKAGLILLGLGSILWILLWGLRNVSSLTQLEPGNILNELVKFGFKVALAYLFITLGLRMVSTYFINPIMGVGAKIAETYWDPEKIKPYTEAYDWELTDEQYEEINKVGVSVMPEQQETAKPKLSEADQAKIALANQKSENFAKAEIPNFIVPPVFEGWLTSPVGCRKHPVTGKYSTHKGLDIGTQGRTGGKIVASGPGKIYYASQPSGAGNYAKIIHEKGWTSLYFHMLPESMKLHPNGSTVAQGEVIGFVGTSGRSSGPHLHFEIKKGTRNVDPLYLLTKVIKYVDGPCNASTVATFPPGFNYHQYVPQSPSVAWTAGGEGIVDLTTIATGVYAPQSFSSLATYQIGDVKYSGPKDIMSEAVMNSILGATKAITDITSENMILGDAVMCYATLDKGGAWHPFGIVVTNFWMWITGAFYWFTGMLLTLAIAYYLLDMSFKIGFAVVALPIVVGLWPFDLTKDKLGVCVSIMAKAAATFAFLAITTTFTVQLTDAVFSYETDETETTAAETETGGPKGLAKLYSVFDRSIQAEKGAIKRTETEEQEDIEYAANKLAVFSTTFVLVLFAFLYSYKLVQKTVPDLVNKFFQDKAFGDRQPMHHWATAASKWVKDQAVKPVSLAADIAMYQGGGALKGMVGKGVGALKGAVGGKKDDAKDGKDGAKNDKQSGKKENKDGGGK